MSQPYRSIDEAATACRQHLQQRVDFSILSPSGDDEWARKRLADFNLWISSSGALAKHSLDERLAAQPEARNVLVNLLCLLEVFLSQCQTTVQVPDEDNHTASQTLVEDNGTPSSIDNLPSHNFREAAHGVETIINQLVRISISIHRSGTRARLERADQTFKADRHDELRDHLSLLIHANTFTYQEKEGGNIHFDISSRSLTEIQLRLIDTNLRRRHRFLYAQKRLKKYEDGGESRLRREKRQQKKQSELSSQVVTISKGEDVGEHGGPHSSSPEDHHTPHTETSTVPTALDGPIQIPEGNQLSMTVASSTSAKVDYPRALKFPGRDVFTCPCCSQSLPIHICSGGRWRKHLAEDISPYTCILPDCPRPLELYSGRKEWMDHMQNDHTSSRYWLCFACSEPSEFNEEIDFVRHLKDKHNDAISADQIPMFVSECSCTVPSNIPPCPLCPPLRADQLNLEAGAILEETARHIHSFSLSSLPWPTPGAKEEEYLGPSDENATADYFDINSNQGSLDQSQSSSSDEIQRGLEVDELSDSELETPVLENQLYLPTIPESSEQWDDVYATSTRRTEQPEPENDPTLQRMIKTYERKVATGAKDREQSNEAMPSKKVLVAIDFGSTFSGIAIGSTFSDSYGASTHPTRTIIRSWGEDTPTSDKVPTVLKYDNDGVSGPFKWGWQVPEGAKRHERFNLGLYPEFDSSQSERSTGPTNPTALPRVSGNDCEKLIVDYLRSLRIHAKSFLQNEFGLTIYGVTPREYIFAIPAMWPAKAKHRLQTCALKAGMGYPKLISGPEAVCLFALEIMPSKAFRAGDTFVVCDAGGRTVDLASYTIQSLSPPVVYESGPSSGGFCGSSLLNEKFSEYLVIRDAKFRDSSWWNQEAHNLALDCFERDIKPQFRGNDRVCWIDFDGNYDRLRGERKWDNVAIPGRELREEVFKPVINEVLTLVQNQIGESQSEVTAVLVAGGFSQNKYFEEMLREAVSGNVQVHFVPDNNTAVLHGALIKMLAEEGKDSLSPLVSRRHLGTSQSVPFDPRKHAASEKYWSQLSNEFRVEEMQWFVVKGAPIKQGQVLSYPFHLQQRVAAAPPTSLEVEIYTCNDSVAPQYKIESVKVVANLRADLSTIPKESFQIKRAANGESFYEINYGLDITFQSGSLVFSITYNEHRFGDVQVDYD